MRGRAGGPAAVVVTCDCDSTSCRDGRSLPPAGRGRGAESDGAFFRCTVGTAGREQAGSQAGTTRGFGVPPL